MLSLKWAETAAWADEFLREVCAFPAGHHDDYVDALVHAIVYLRFDSMNNWHRWGRDCAMLNVAREHSPAVAATRFGIEVEQVEDLVADYKEAGEELIAEY